MSLTNGTDTIGISPYYENIHYSPLGEATVAAPGSDYKFGDLWYVYGKNNQIVSHGYVDPDPYHVAPGVGHLQIRSFIPIQLPNENMIGLSPYGLSFVTEEGSGFQHSGITYSKRNYIFDIPIETSSTVHVDYTTTHYYYNGISTHFSGSFGISYTNQTGNNILQKSLGISNISDDFEEGNYIYQKNNRDDVNIKMYSLFGNDYLSSIGYDSSEKITNQLGEEQPGMVFKPLRNDFFSPQGYTEGSDTTIYYGTSSTSVTNFQDIVLMSQQGSSFTFRCNPYIYPLNNQVNYNFEIGGVENPSIFNFYSINNEKLSQLNTIQSTDPSVLIGKSSTGISLNSVESINELFFKDLFTDIDKFGLTNRDLQFKQLRSNNNGLYKDSALNCTMFYDEDIKKGPNYPLSNTYKVTYTNHQSGGGQYNFEDEETKKLINPTVPLTCLTNYACQLNQSTMTDNPILFYRGGVSITNAGGEDPYPIGEDNLYINYFLNNMPVNRESYIDTHNFKSDNIGSKFINLTYQSNIGDSAGDPGVTLTIKNSDTSTTGKSLTFTTQ